jgi:hypothetical protein
MEAIKKCSRCGIEKEVVNFRRDANTKDGHRSACKTCIKISDAIYQKSITSEQNRKRHDKFRNTHRRQIAEYLNRIRKENPDKARAWDLVSKAINNGKFTRKPCEICGGLNTHAHHEDYSKPYDVQWLCPLHHKEIHKNKQVLSGGR